MSETCRMCLRVWHSQLLAELGEAGPAGSTGGAVPLPVCNATTEETEIIACAQCVTVLVTTQPSGSPCDPAGHSKVMYTVELHGHSRNNALPTAGALPEPAHPCHQPRSAALHYTGTTLSPGCRSGDSAGHTLTDSMCLPWKTTLRG